MEEKLDYGALSTENYNPRTADIDKMDSRQIAAAINEEDKTVALAVEKELDSIAAAIDLLTEALRQGGRIFYCGAGTSGRLGMLDALECLPTYGLADTIIGIMAGGRRALYDATEEAEDNYEEISDMLKEYDFCAHDVCIGLSASGSAECVKGAMDYAKACGAKTVSVTCNKANPLIARSDIAISVVVGPEVINGSTRMKAGTAQKLVLNMLSTGAMVRFGRVRGNYMAYMVPTNKKLADRAVRIIMDKTGVSQEEAACRLQAAGNVIADAIDAIEGSSAETSPKTAP